MKNRNQPSLDARYWAAILAASLLGTTLGDEVSQGLHLGYLKGLLPLGLLLAVTFLAERRAKSPSEVYYWIAIIITRTGATNIADFATHQLKIDYRLVAASLAALLIVALLRGRASTPGPVGLQEGQRVKKALPVTDALYWTAIVIASTLGTTLGDFVSDGLGLGVGRGSIVLGIILTSVLVLQSRARGPGKALYWTTIVTVRTAGTVMGDFLSTAEGLDLGFLWSAVCTALLLVAILSLWKKS